LAFSTNSLKETTMPSKKSVIRPVVLAVSALFATGVYAQYNVDTNNGISVTAPTISSSSVDITHSRILIVSGPAGPTQSSTRLDEKGLETSNLKILGKADFSGAVITGLTGQFDPTQAGALSGVTTLRGSGTSSIDLTTGEAKLGVVSVGGSLDVNNGIKNKGYIQTDNINIAEDAKVDGKLNVKGQATTGGINSTGTSEHIGNFKANASQTVDDVLSGTGISLDPTQIMVGAINNQGIHSAIRFSPTGPAQLMGDLVVTSEGLMGSNTGGNLKVMGTTTLQGATTVNNTLAVNGATTIVGTTSVTGATTIVGATNINTTGTAATSIGNADAAATVVGNVVTATAGNSALALQNGEARVTVTNSLGNTHGLVVGESSTTLSGGTRSTNLTLNDNGATFSNAATGAPTRVTGVANGASDFDAVNVRQFSAAVAGVAASANIPGLDTNKTTSVGVGIGSYMSSQALAFGGSYRFSDKGVLRASLATGLNTGGSKTTLGIGAGWSW
jgi:hypothetical protein